MRHLPGRIRSAVLSESASAPDLSYIILWDNVNVANNNAEVLFMICSENGLVVVNNLRTSHKHFLGNKIYKKRKNWISELVTRVPSVSLLNNLSDFRVLQQHNLPSDHAPPK